MKMRIALLSIFFLSTILLSTLLIVQAEDLRPARGIHRLEYVHFDAETQTVKWEVSEGTIDDAGKFVRNDDSLTTYSINLETGVMTRDGEDGQLSPGDANGAARAFRALALLMQDYTDHWDKPNDPDAQNSQQDNDDPEDGSAESISRVLRTIATPSPARRSSRPVAIRSDDPAPYSAPEGLKPHSIRSFAATTSEAGCPAARKQVFESQIFSALRLPRQ